MLKISDMSEQERKSWVTFLADSAVFSYFLIKFTTGFPPRLKYNSLEEFGAVLVGLIVVAIILHVVISVMFDLNSRKEPYNQDERDDFIQRKATRWAYGIMQYGVGAVIIMTLLQLGIGDTYRPPIMFKTPVHILFHLIVVSYLADLVKHGMIISAYRRF